MNIVYSRTLPQRTGAKVQTPRRFAAAGHFIVRNSTGLLVACCSSKRVWGTRREHRAPGQAFEHATIYSGYTSSRQSSSPLDTLDTSLGGPDAAIKWRFRLQQVAPKLQHEHRITGLGHEAREGSYHLKPQD